MPRAVVVVQHQANAPAGAVLPALAAARLAADVRRPYAGDTLPAGADGLGGLVVLGASYAAWEDERAPHLPVVRRLIADAHARDVPVLGICLGAQLAAQALGGEARRGDSGFEVGWSPLTPAGDDPVTAALEPGDELLLWHQDTWVRPPGASSLLCGGRYVEQGFRLGSVWALQPHPEVDEPILRAWCADPEAGSELAEGGTGGREVLRDVAARGAAGRRLLGAWAERAARRFPSEADGHPPGP